MRNRLAKFDDLEVRMVEGRETEEGTFLFGPLGRALAICREADMQVRFYHGWTGSRCANAG